MRPVPPLHSLAPGGDGYPPRLARAPVRDKVFELTVIGDPGLLRTELLAVFTSLDTPPDLVLPSLDLVKHLRDTGTPVVGGFQAPLEREWLRVLLRGRQPVVVCLARGLSRLRLNAGWRNALAEGRLAVVSAEALGLRRGSAREALRRNRLVAALAERLLVVHARPGTRVFGTAAFGLQLERKVYCIDHPRNRDLALIGAQPAAAAPLIRALTPAAPASRS
jgi:predicted Rossmann fold nucleotide-binding protein DprA/Smf involved in DNA uptake